MERKRQREEHNRQDKRFKGDYRDDLRMNPDANHQALTDATNKYAENIAGKFYVDKQCIDCGLCREIAPGNFKRNGVMRRSRNHDEYEGYSYVYKQPSSADEEARCNEAKEACPVEAINDDGQ